MKPLLSEAEKFGIMDLFDRKCDEVCHKVCKNCKMTGIGVKLNAKGFCISKCAYHQDKEHLLKSNGLPVWYSGGVPIYTLPECLVGLSIAERLLIQRISPFVPLMHLKSGVMGMTGHCCAFEQDVEGFVNRLPRKKKMLSC